METYIKTEKGSLFKCISSPYDQQKKWSYFKKQKFVAIEDAHFEVNENLQWQINVSLMRQQKKVNVYSISSTFEMDSNAIKQFCKKFVAAGDVVYITTLGDKAYYVEIQACVTKDDVLINGGNL